MPKVLTIIGIIVIIAVIAVGGYFAWAYFNPKEYTVEKSETQVQSQPSSETAGWKTYRNDEYGFEIKYPQNWCIKEKEPNVNIKLVVALSNCSVFPYALIEFGVGTEKENKPVPNQMVHYFGFNESIGGHYSLFAYIAPIEGSSDNIEDISNKMISTFKFTK